MPNIKTPLIKYQNDIIIVSMNLLIRNIPTEVHQKLRERAKSHHRSLNQEIVSVLVGVSDQETDEMRLQKRREQMRLVSQNIETTRSQMSSFWTPKEIDQAKREGRV